MRWATCRRENRLSSANRRSRAVRMKLPNVMCTVYYIVHSGAEVKPWIAVGSPFGQGPDGRMRLRRRLADAQKISRERNRCDYGPRPLQQHERHEIDEIGGQAGERGAHEVERQIDAAVGTQGAEQVQKERQEQQRDAGRADDRCVDTHHRPPGPWQGRPYRLSGDARSSSRLAMWEADARSQVSARLRGSCYPTETNCAAAACRR